MISFSKTRKIAINCRCGKRTIWNIPEEVKACIDNHTPMVMERSGEGNQTIIAIDVAWFTCQCTRVFEYTAEGVRNATAGTECTQTKESIDINALYEKANKGMVN